MTGANLQTESFLTLQSSQGMNGTRETRSDTLPSDLVLKEIKLVLDSDGKGVV